jgi:hypothetical protein
LSWQCKGCQSAVPATVHLHWVPRMDCCHHPLLVTLSLNGPAIDKYASPDGHQLCASVASSLVLYALPAHFQHFATERQRRHHELTLPVNGRDCHSPASACAHRHASISFESAPYDCSARMKLPSVKPASSMHSSCPDTGQHICKPQLPSCSPMMVTPLLPHGHLAAARSLTCRPMLQRA